MTFTKGADMEGGRFSLIYFFRDTGRMSVSAVGNPSDTRKTFIEQIPLSERFRKATPRLFVPCGEFSTVRFLTHVSDGEPRRLKCIYPRAQKREDNENEREDFSPYQGGRLYELEERDQTLLILQRIVSGTCTLFIVDTVGRELFVRRIPLTVSSDAVIAGISEDVWEKYEKAIKELLPCEPKNPFAERKEEEEWREAGEERGKRGRELARKLMEKIRSTG